MAKTPTQLQATITANFPDNTSAAITPALLRAQQNEIATSFNYGAYLTSNTTVESASINYCDTSAGAFSLTLPTSPAIGDMIRVRDVSGTWSTANLSLLPAGNKIESDTSTFVCDTSDANFDLIWRGGSVGWGVQFGVSLIERKPSTIQTMTFASTGGGSVGFVGRGAAPTGAFAMTGVGAVAWVSNNSIVANWNPSDKNAAVTLTNSNLTATLGSAAVDAGVRGNTPNTGHKYFEVSTVVADFGAIMRIGVANTTQPLTTGIGTDEINGASYSSHGFIEGPASNNSTGMWYGPAQTIGVELWQDGSHSKCVFYRDNVFIGQVNALPSGLLYPAVSFETLNDSVTVNLGATAFTYTPPAGATAWNT